VSDKIYALDASALLAVMFGEIGADGVSAVLDRALIGAVNLSEVVAKLQNRVVPDDAIDQSLADLTLTVVPSRSPQTRRGRNSRSMSKLHWRDLDQTPRVSAIWWASAPIVHG